MYNGIDGLFVPTSVRLRKVVVPRPLSFDRVKEGYPITSKMALFELPIELLNDITAYLDAEDLKSLALVDRDCRQLARSAQFCTVTLDYSPQKRDLLAALDEEARSRSTDNGCLQSPSIGACVRRLIVATKSGHVKAPDASQQSHPEGNLAIQDQYLGPYTVRIASALSNALPNLEEFCLHDRTVAPEHLLGAIPAPPIRHLKLVRIALADDDAITIPSTARWKVETLEMEEVVRDLSSLSSRCTARFCKSVLEATTGRLERLVWHGHFDDQQSFGEGGLRFPKLKTLSLSLLSLPDDSVLSSFFPGDGSSVLQTLSIGFRTDRARAFLRKLGQIETLESLHCHTLSVPRDPDVSFIAANPQLRSLSLSPHSNQFLITTLLPTLTKFTRLASLSLTFQSPVIEPSALAYISKINTLQQLWLSAGKQVSWATDWEIDHETLLSSLSPLQSLRRLAFTRDTYKSEGGVPPTQYYYEYRIMPTDMPLPELSDDELEVVWEEWHKERMVDIARRYFDRFKKLKWVLVGMYPMGIVHGEVVVESIARDSYEGELRKRWGLDV